LAAPAPPAASDLRYRSGVFATNKLSGRARRVASAAVQGAWAWACQVGAVAPDSARGRRFGRMGQGSLIAFPPGAVFGERWIHVGENTMIGPHVTISAGMVPGQQMVTDPVISIGDRCCIGRGSCIVGHLRIEIGDDVYTGPYVYVTDQNHDYQDLDVPIGRQWPSDAQVRIGAGSWLGAGVAVLPGADVGEHVVVAAGSVVRGHIPDRCVVAGAPARIVRQYVDGLGWVAPPRPAGSEGLPSTLR